MDSAAYKAFHENFVSNSKGTSLMEVNLISSLCPLSVMILAAAPKSFTSACDTAWRR